MTKPGLLVGLAWSIIVMVHYNKEVQCNDDNAESDNQEIKYLNEYRLTEMFLKIDPVKVPSLLEATAKVVREYTKTKPEKVQRVVERTTEMMNKTGKRTKQYNEKLDELKPIREQIKNILQNYSVLAFLNMTDEIYKTKLSRFNSDIKNGYSFLEGIDLDGLYHTKDEIFKSYKTVRDFTKYFNKAFKTKPILRSMKEAGILKEKLHKFFMGIKSLQKATVWISKSIRQLKIPQIDESSNCDKQSQGVNLITTEDGASFLAVCDGEWLVVAQRFDGSVNFRRPFDEYSVPFGDPPSEYFIGLDNMVSAASQDMYMLRIELTTWENETRTADYLRFDMTPMDYSYWYTGYYYRPAVYGLRLSDFQGTAGNSLYHGHKFENGFGFNDDLIPTTGECTEEESGWWWGHCGRANLFGRYNSGRECDTEMDCMSWEAWPEQLLEGKSNKFYSFKAMRIMIRPHPIDSSPGCSAGTDNAHLLGRCDGRWLIVAHRFDGSVNFRRTIAEYRAGFGNVSGEYFIGLDNLINLLDTRNYVFKLEFTSWTGQIETAEYYVFRLGGNYWGSDTSIRLEDFRGSGKDVMSTTHYYHYSYGTELEHPFTTSGYCAKLRRGAWWFGGSALDGRKCGATNPFGPYMNGPKCDKELRCMTWMGWPGELFSEAERKKNKKLHNGWYSFKEMRFLIRPREPDWV